MPTSDLSSYQAYFDASLEKTLARYEERVGEVFPAITTVTCVDDRDFWAYAKPNSDRLKLKVSKGAFERIRDVWSAALEFSAELPDKQQIVLLGHRDHAIETSFAWLLQHELNHHAIGHFDLLNGAALAEGASPYGLGIVQKKSQKTEAPQTASEEEQANIHLCLELQTDHDAMEIVLGAYSKENWPLFRYYATCILVVLFIIEVEERNKLEPLRYHPLAATRLFMLIAHLCELPMVPGIKRAQSEGLDHLPSNYLPTSDELIAYRSEVVGSVMAATQIIADACSMPDFWSEAGSADSFFDDIDAIMIHGATEPEDFTTPGAKQWARLKRLNQEVLTKLGW